MGDSLITAGITYQADGMAAAVRGMSASLTALNTHTDNIAYHAIPGYQKKTPVMRRFSQHLGPMAVEQNTSEEIGRLRRTGKPTELALGTPGYFQVVDATTGLLSTTRDGRFLITKAGHLTTLDGRKHFMDQAGQPLQLPALPNDPETQLKIDHDGVVYFYNRYGENQQSAGQLAIVSSAGTPVTQVEVHQGVVEDSNVMLAEEFASILPKRREFEATRQMFILQSDSLSRMVQELGRAQ